MDDNLQADLLRQQAEEARNIVFDCRRRQHVAQVQLVEHLRSLGEAEAAVAGTRSQLASLGVELAAAEGLLQSA